MTAKTFAYFTAATYAITAGLLARTKAVELGDLAFWTALVAWSATTRIQFPLGFSLSQLYVVALAAAFATEPLTASLAVFIGYYNPKLFKGPSERYPLAFDLFNRGQHALATLAAAFAWDLARPSAPTLIGDAGAAWLAGAAYLVVNALLVALIASTYYRAPFPSQLGEHLQFGLPYFLFVPVSLVLARIYNLPTPLLGPSNAFAVVALLVPIYYAKWRWDEVVRLRQAFEQFARSLANTIDAKDPYTRNHSERVAAIVRDIALQLGLSKAEAEQLTTAALLHDIGKLAIPDAVLLKPGRLTDEEWAIMRRHPTEGGRILQEVELLKPLVPVALYHHERWDGRGYPLGLKGEEIPLSARIAAVADAFEAMTSPRPYRPPLPLETALAEIRAQSGRQFDPAVTEAFFRAVEQNPAWLHREEWLERFNNEAQND